MHWIVLALVMMGQSSAAAAQTGPGGSYLMGRTDSPVKIDLFSDFECPSCRAFYLDTVSRLIDEYSAGNKVAVIYHDFPLAVHASSRKAARYSLAVKCLGPETYLKVIGYLYTCQAEWAYDGNIERVLSRVLTPDQMAKVKESLKDPSIEQTIDHEVALGDGRKITATPTFFLTMAGKEQRVEGGLPYTVLKAYISPGLK